MLNLILHKRVRFLMLKLKVDRQKRNENKIKIGGKRVGKYFNFIGFSPPSFFHFFFNIIYKILYISMLYIRNII